MSQPDLDTLFDRRVILPDRDGDARARLARVVGRDDAIERLSKLLSVLIRPERLDEWVKKYHPGSSAILAHAKKRHPLVILSGDVGTGKTEIAETIGDKVARDEKIDITLFPMSLSARGSGLVGEMTLLVSGAFDAVEQEGAKIARRKDGSYAAGILLLLDEADALAQSRENTQMHHEDRAGVNALIRGLDVVSRKQIPVAVVMCTNRLSAIDPAIQRRAADIFIFDRPDEEQRRAVLMPPLKEIGFTDEQIGELVALTGASNGKYPFTFSDLTRRFLYAVVMDAYPDSPIMFERAIRILRDMESTTPFGE